MRSPVLSFIVLAGLLIHLSACENCGPSAEPLLTISFVPQANATASPMVDTLYSLDSRQALPLRAYQKFPLRSATVPLNLNADSTRYVFESGGRRDTLTVFYVRDVGYRNRKCGYVIELIDPKGKQARTTRGIIDGVFYLRNQDRSFFNDASDTSIQLSIRL